MSYRQHVAVGIIASGLLGAAFAPAQTPEAPRPSPAGEQADVTRLNERVKALEAKLEAQAAEQQDFLSAYRAGFKLGVFGDAVFSTKSRDLKNAGFALGQTDLYGTAHAGDHLNMLSELVLEYDGMDPVADLERLWVGYTVSDALTIRFGKHHTAYGYWSKSFHHGALLYTTIGRPFFLKFEDEGGVIPAHLTGFEFEGSLPTALAKFKYEAQVGNGTSVVNGPEGTGELDQQAVGDDNADKLFILKLSAYPVAIPGCDVGIFGSYTKAVARSDDPILTSFVRYDDAPQAIAGAYLAYVANKLELIAEYFHINNSIDGLNDYVSADGATVLAADSRRTANNAFYVQLGRTLFEKYTPYVRYERLFVDDDDAYMLDLNQSNRRQWLAGLRYDLAANSCLKFQYRNDRSEGRTTGEGAIPDRTFNVFEFQWAFNF